MKNENVCCFITGAFMPFLKEDGNNAQKNEFKEKIRQEIKNLIENENVKLFYSGMEEGADLFASDFVLSLKDKNDIFLNCVIPFEEQAADYDEKTRDLYFSVASRCDNEIMFRRKREFSCRKKRDIYMIDKSNIVFFFWDMKDPYTFSLISYASNKKKIILLDPLYSQHNSSVRRIGIH